ncbi:CBO0543 family protein [Alicyclobacillus fastidiosus]|uniref:CBO0543 family protein n=1 Tax=Alicyclobacillus fastidiosus TaxID=392011 RepID=A0ABV5ACX6_9BACL|nr:CBO0543 family protein [Alicyclobacillus fastidiosus]WEH08844.1 hypothetical protein PYS47_19460 [Alicyclobacillus fastidiosus]
MFIIVRAVIWVLLFWRWGDWPNWKKYQAGILFFIMGDLLYNFLCCNYSMWEHSANRFFPNHTSVTLFIALIIYLCAIILNLGHYPTSLLKQILWMTLWVVASAIAEWIDKLLGLITYHHGWNLWWSTIFMLVAVPMVRLHYKQPLWAYALSVIVVALLLWKFHVSILK